MLWSFTPAARREEGPFNFCAGPSPTTRQWICPKSRRISPSARQQAPSRLVSLQLIFEWRRLHPQCKAPQQELTLQNGGHRVNSRRQAACFLPLMPRYARYTPMANPIMTSEKCTAGATRVPARNSDRKVKTLVPQVRSMYTPIASKMFAVRLLSFMGLRESTRTTPSELATQWRKGYTGCNSWTKLVTTNIW